MKLILLQAEETVMPYLTALAEFRNSVRDVARTQKSVEILKICDAFRDDVLPNLGVRLEDRDSGPASIKLVDRETLLREREAKKQLEAEKQALKEQKRLEAAAAAAALEAQRKINPKEMFLSETDKYSAFDERVSYNQQFTVKSNLYIFSIFELIYFFATGNSNDRRKR